MFFISISLPQHVLLKIVNLKRQITENPKILQTLSVFTNVNPTFAINTALLEGVMLLQLFPDLGELIMYHTI